MRAKHKAEQHQTFFFNIAVYRFLGAWHQAAAARIPEGVNRAAASSRPAWALLGRFCSTPANWSYKRSLFRGVGTGILKKRAGLQPETCFCQNTYYFPRGRRFGVKHTSSRRQVGVKSASIGVRSAAEELGPKIVRVMGSVFGSFSGSVSHAFWAPFWRPKSGRGRVGGPKGPQG